MCALYLYYFASLTQIICVLASPKKLVPATTSHSAPPLKSQRWCSCSGAHGSAPVPVGANVRPSHPCPTNSPSSPSIPSVPCWQQTIHCIANPQEPMVALLFRSPWWRSCSGACLCPSVPPPSHQRPIQSIRPIPPIIAVTSQCIKADVS